jgi:hypothetical protein
MVEAAHKLQREATMTDLHDFAKRYQKHTKAIAEAIRDEILRDHTAIRKHARSEFSPLHVLYFPLACTMRSN